MSNEDVDSSFVAAALPTFISEAPAAAPSVSPTADSAAPVAELEPVAAPQGLLIHVHRVTNDDTFTGSRAAKPPRC